MAYGPYNYNDPSAEFEKYKLQQLYGTSDPNIIHGYQEQESQEQQRRGQYQNELAMRDVVSADKARERRMGNYSSPDEMLMDEYGPAYQTVNDTPERSAQMDISFPGEMGPLPPLTLRKREVRPEFKPALDALRPKNFQPESRTASNPLSSAFNGMTPDEIVQYGRDNNLSTVDMGRGRVSFGQTPKDYNAEGDAKIRVEERKAALRQELETKRQELDALETTAKIEAGGIGGELDAPRIAKDYSTSVTQTLKRQPIEMSVAPKKPAPQQGVAEPKSKGTKDVKLGGKIVKMSLEDLAAYKSGDPTIKDQIKAKYGA